MRSQWFGIVALGWLIFAGNVKAADVDPTTAKSVLKSYIAAMIAGDDATVRRLTVQEPEQQKSATALARYERALVKVEAASQRRFKISFFNDGTADAIPTPDPEAVDKAKVETTDGGTTLTLADVKESYRVLQLNGVNFIDLKTEDMKTVDDLKMFANITDSMATALVKVADRIDHGDFKTIVAAREASAIPAVPIAATMPTAK